MVFNSFQFLWLFPLIFIVYYVLANIPRVKSRTRHKVTNFALIIVSYGLYMQWKPAYALILLGITAVTYLSALVISRNEAYAKRKFLISICAVITLIPLIAFKYYNFINDTVGGLLASLGIATGLPGLNWAIPIGISFFSFQALGYLFDVYYKRIVAEKNWWDYMLFVSFFPQILSGPISKAKDLLPQIKADRQFDYSQAVSGMRLLLWGMFLKVVMADRLGLYVDMVFNNWQNSSSLSCLFAAFFYSFQIYGDFAGYSLMAVGTGKLMGIELVNNFNRPYLSVSITDFWHRWHISLSSWLKDYIYIPLGGSRCCKARNYFNILITFLVSGIWHGANWTFIVWGVLHGVFQVIEKALGLQKCESKCMWVRLPRIIVTFILISFLWTIFRASSISCWWGFISRIFVLPHNAISLYLFILSLLLGLVFLVALSKFLENRYDMIVAMMENRHRTVKWIVFAAAVFLVLIFFQRCFFFDICQNEGFSAVRG